MRKTSPLLNANTNNSAKVTNRAEFNFKASNNCSIDADKDKQHTPHAEKNTRLNKNQ